MKNWEEVFTAHDVIWQYPGNGPHASYSLSDQHSDFYFNSDYLICNPPLLKQACEELFFNLTNKLDAKPDWVVTYPPYGMNIGFCLAEFLQCKFAYIKSLDQPDLNFDIKPSDSLLFCADDLYTGGSFRKAVGAVALTGALVASPMVVVANFSGASTFDGHEVLALLHKNISMWSSASCPMCQAGSSPLPARKNWRKLLSGK